MYDRTGNYLIVAILIGMILGVVVVAIFGEAVLPVKFLGDIFLNALKMVVIPLLFCSMIVGITNLGDVRKLGRTGLKTLLYFLVTSSIAVVIGLILVNIIQPGVGFPTFGASLPKDVIGGESYSFFSWLTDQIPSNIIGAAAEMQVLPIIVFALFFGGVLTTIGAKGKPVIDFFEGLNEAIMKIVHIIMWYAPIGIFGLVASQLAANGGLSGFSGVLSALGKYSLVVLLGLFIHGVIILPLILKFMGGKNPIEYFMGMSQALVTAFATASSSATLPVTMECTEEKNDVDKRASSFVLPLGATINMDGTALYEAVAAMFIAQAYGIALPIWSQITIFATAVLASVGAAGIPQAGLVTMVLVLQAVGLPLEGIGLILAVDWFLDRCRTTVNVWGDSIGAAVIATTAEIGLVDRTRLKVARTDRPARFQRFTRRSDARGPRKPQEATAPQSRERAPFKGKKADGPAKDFSRRSPKPTRKPDRFAEKRSSRKDQKPDGFTPTARREEYKPREAETKEKTVKDTPVTAEPASSPEKSTATGQDRKKSTFGRRRSRPQHTRAKSQGDDAKTSKFNGAGSDRADETASERNPEPAFEVPKFPASILDDLVAGRQNRPADKPVVNAGTGPGEADGSEVESEVTQANDEKPSGAFAAREEAAGHDNESTSDDLTLAGNPTGDFSRLDQAVLGSSDSNRRRDNAPADSPEAEDSSVSPDNGHVLSETEVGSPAIEMSDFSDDLSAAETDDVMVSEHEDRDEKIYGAGMDDEPAALESGSEDMENVPEHKTHRWHGSETKKDTQMDSTVDADMDRLEDNDAAKGADTESEETKDADAATDDDESKNESMKWGRPKRKKMSR